MDSKEVFRVREAGSGDIYTIRLDTVDFSLHALRTCLSTFSGIPPSDQILLIGPPYKSLESKFTFNLQENGQLIFLYDRRKFSDDFLSMSDIRLKPFDIPEPGLTGNPMSLSLGDSTSPILRVIPDYERQYLIHLRKGEAFLDASEEAGASCRRCVAQMEVQCQAMEALISSLTEHYNITQSNFECIKRKQSLLQHNHISLLDFFDQNLSRLGRVPLHPTLRNSTDASWMCNTLLDTVPMDKERAWVDKCRHGHRKILENLAHLQKIFVAIAEDLKDVDVSELRKDVQGSIKLMESIEARIHTQRFCMRELREAYRNIHDSLSTIVDRSLISDDLRNTSEYMSLVQSTEDESTNIVKSLALGARKQEVEVILLMETRCRDIMKDKDVIAEAKNKLTRAIRHTMQQAAVIQSDIRFKLKTSLERIYERVREHNGYFKHLQNIRFLPEAYRDFLYEVIRRRQYTEEFEAIVEDYETKISTIRNEETKNREHFLSTVGCCLPPLFFDRVPSLDEKPPRFSVCVTEGQYLPEVHHEDIIAIMETGVYGSVTCRGFCSGSPRARNIAENVDKIVEVNMVTSEDDRLKQLELENIYLRQLLASQSSDSHERSLAVSPSIQEILSQLLEDLYSITSSTVILNGEKDGQHEVLIGAYGEEELHKSADLRVSEILDIIEKVNRSIRRTQQAFDEKLKCLSSGDKVVQTKCSLDIRIENPSATRCPVPTISFLSFEVGNIALFLPTNKQDVYLAFSKARCPNRYLSQDSLRNFKTSDADNPGFIVGRIIYIEAKVASKDDPLPGIGPASNPLRLSDGVKYFLMDVEQIFFGAPTGTINEKKSPNTGLVGSGTHSFVMRGSPSTENKG